MSAQLKVFLQELFQLFHGSFLLSIILYGVILYLFVCADRKVFLQEQLQLLHVLSLLSVRLFLSENNIPPELKIVKYYIYCISYIYFV